MSHVPESITVQDLIYCFVNNDSFSNSYEFDQQHRIIQSEQINSGASEPTTSELTLQQCLAGLSNLEYLKDADMYECITCKTKQNAIKIS